MCFGGRRTTQEEIPLPARPTARTSTARTQNLYLALYARGGKNPRIPHSALLVGPKIETATTRGVRYHVKERPTVGGGIRWDPEFLDVASMSSRQLLARILIAEVTDHNQLRRVLERNPVVQGNPEWRCRHWIKAGLAELATLGGRGGLGNRVDLRDWDRIFDFGVEYVERKKALGRYLIETADQWPEGTSPTYDLINNRELMR